MPSASNPISINRLERLAGLVSHPKTHVLSDTGSVVAGGRLSLMLLETFGSAPNSSFIATLKACGVPTLSALLFKDRLQRGDCLVMVEGSSTDLPQAEAILRSCQICDWQLLTTACPSSILADDQRQGVGVFQPTLKR
jgi:hypothetical protein